MGTHPIFESDFDCLTEFEWSPRWDLAPRQARVHWFLAARHHPFLVLKFRVVEVQWLTRLLKCRNLTQMPCHFRVYQDFLTQIELRDNEFKSKSLLLVLIHSIKKIEF